MCGLRTEEKWDAAKIKISEKERERGSHRERERERENVAYFDQWKGALKLLAGRDYRFGWLRSSSWCFNIFFHPSKEKRV